MINLVETNSGQAFYHVTPTVNLASIQANGLVPQSGGRSEQMGDHGIFMFASPEDAEDAVMNWLGDEFGEDEPLTLLKITLPAEANVSREAFEIVCHDPIPPQYIEVVGEL